jgi:L-glyceraldehyde 3-phosphate reductase
MALSWVLKDKRITSVLIGASSIEQLEDNLRIIKNYNFNDDELTAINKILSENA